MNNESRIKVTILVFLFLGWPGSTAAFQEPEDNVNSRYKVESVQLSGVAESRISKALHEDMDKLVGEKFNQEAADKIAKRIRKELPDFAIEVKIRRGDQHDHVKVIFEAERYWWRRFDLQRSRAVYESKEGWSGEFSATFGTRHSAITVGYVNSSDEFLERNMGFRAGFEQRKVFTDRLRLRLGFESYNQKWNPATEAALTSSPDIPGIYRERQDFAPTLALLPWRGLEIDVGASFQQLQTQYPVIHTDAAYAGTMTVAFRHRFVSSTGLRQRVGAEYRLRSATRVLESDFVYTRHAMEAQYTADWGRNHVSLRASAGRITGAAPLFERFSPGNSLTLRGWNKFDVAPLGGNRLAYASVEYHYSDIAVFYDTGGAWDSGKAAVFRHSVGFGFAERHGAFLLLGFPLRLNHVEPIVTFGIRF